MRDYNYAAAFIAFSKGSSPEEISLALAIPLDTLKNKIRIESWRRLATDLALPALPVARAERDMEKIAENRAKNLAIAQRLQEDLLDVVTQLRAGTLTFERMTAKGEMVRLEPTLRDRRDLAAYAKDVAEISYRALGDVVAVREGGEATAGAGQITIILPSPVAAPREKRAYDVDAEVLTPALVRPAILGDRLPEVIDVGQEAGQA